MSIADMVSEMLVRGVPHDVIVLAVRTAESGNRVDSRVDIAAEKRRAWDREYRAKKRTVHPIPPDNPPDIGRAHIDTYLLTISNKKVSKKSISRGSPLPPDWAPDEDDRQYAAQRGWPQARIDSEAERFRNRSLDKGTLHKNIKAAWRNWVTSPYQKPEPGGGKIAGGVLPIVVHGQLIDGKTYLRADTEEWDAWCAHLRQNGEHPPPRYFHGGWKFASRWPPGHPNEEKQQSTGS
jgi:hypothetical protein